MDLKRIVYLANARLPTEKAHGYQICKMCEAFEHNGVEVVLMHPDRHQFDPRLREQSVFDYYGIQRRFEVRTLPNWDVVRLSVIIPNRLFTPIFFAHALIWGLYAVLIARKERADCYYTRDSAIAYWLVRLGLPTVYEAHVVPRRGQYFLLKSIARSAAIRLVIVITSFIRERFLAIDFPPEKVMVLPDGVDLSLFENLSSKEECRQHLGLPEDRPIIGYIGRFRTLEMEKGIPQLIGAMALLPRIQGEEPLLLCVGGPMVAVPRYLELARQVGLPQERLRFIDRVPNTEVPYWIRAFDVAVAPFPNNEHYAYFMSPLKLFEYMAGGVPIVASDLPSIREVLQHSKSSWLVRANDLEALAEGIRHLLNSRPLRQCLAEQARQAVNRYTWISRARVIVPRVGAWS
jgi:glycosyltransferase involved in cell wall biosynthesis